LGCVLPYRKSKISAPIEGYRPRPAASCSSPAPPGSLPAAASSRSRRLALADFLRLSPAAALAVVRV